MVFGQAISDITSTAEYVNQWADQHGYAQKVKDEAISFLLNHFCKRFPYFETIYLQSLKLWCGNVLHGRNGYKQWTRKTLKTKIGWANKLWAYCENLLITMVPNIAVATDVMPVASRTKSSRKKRNASYNSLSTQQCLQALDAAKATDDQQLEDLILLAMYTGCRLSELTHMKVEQVSKDRFTVEDSKRMLENAKFPSIQTFNKW